MGIDVKRFPNEVPEEFLCQLCSHVLDSPVEDVCGHAFCHDCIQLWVMPFSVQKEGSSGHDCTILCPVTGKPLSGDDFIEVTASFSVLLSNLEIRCDNEANGCDAIMPLWQLEAHLEVS